MLFRSLAADGESDEALEHYRQAMALDEGYLEPMLNAAELLVHPLGEYDEAIVLCDDVLSMCEEKDEVADAVLLKCDALLAKGAADEAERCLAMLPEGPYESGNTYFAIGRSYYELGKADLADENLRAAIERDAEHADAAYHLGLIADERGDADAATTWFLRARELDLLAAPPGWSLPGEAFAKACREALDALGPEHAEKLRGAKLYVGDVQIGRAHV